MIRTENVTKIFNENQVETVVLKDVNISIEQGEFVSIVGPSGAGKSTLLNILGLMYSPTSGSYWLNDRDVSKMSDFQRTAIRRGKIGYVFQCLNLINELSIYENIELPLIYMKVQAAERKNRVNKVLEQMRISHRKTSLPVNLSMGQQQMVAIARAMVIEPELILADEPTGSLDSVNGTQVMNVLADLNNEGTTIVFVTHSQVYAEKANRIIQLFDGHVLTENFRKAI